MVRSCLLAAIVAVGFVGAVSAETLVANTTIRGQNLIGPDDVVLVEGSTPGALSDPLEAIGLEARINLYPGRPIRPGDLRPAAVVERNDIVTMRYEHSGLIVVTEGRAMDRAAAGEPLRVLNLSSRNTVTAIAAAPGLVTIGALP